MLSSERSLVYGPQACLQVVFFEQERNQHRVVLGGVSGHVFFLHLRHLRAQRRLHGRRDNVGVFTYSEEPNSGAAPLGDPVPAALKEERRARILEAQQPIAKAKNQAKKGKTFVALLEGPSEETEHLLEARLTSQAPEIDGRVLINEVPEGFLPGPSAMVKVKITKAHEYDLVGRIVA